MMDQHEDPKFEQWLKDVARTTYHAPRTTPRDEMWARIDAARRTRHVIELRPWMRWAVAAAAVLALGIGIGRWTATPPASTNGTRVAATASAEPAPSDVVVGATLNVPEDGARQSVGRPSQVSHGFRRKARRPRPGLGRGG